MELPFYDFVGRKVVFLHIAPSTAYAILFHVYVTQYTEKIIHYLQS